MNSILVILTLLPSFCLAQTKEIICEFSEPNFSLTYQVDQATMIWQGYGKDGKPSQYIMGKQLALEATGNDPLVPEYRIVVAMAGKVLNLKFDFKGSDQQSQWVYPISAEWGSLEVTEKIAGGCYTDQISAIDLEDPSLGEIEEY